MPDREYGSGVIKGSMNQASSSALLIDFGSTYTKLRAVDIAGRRIIGSGQGPSTVTSDVTVGFREALADLERRIGGLPAFRHRLASSSAAGGLRMVTVGLVPDLTAEAARRAALGAGAKLVGTFSYHLTREDVTAIRDLKPDILLLAGGTDGGNRDVIVGNAAALGGAGLECPVVLAGNRSAVDEAREQLAGVEVIVTENVMPEYNVLNIEPARHALRQVFIDRVVHAKGIDRAQALFDAVLMPTPAAVMEGARLLADGVGEERPGLGGLLVVDPGGATTDVHSIWEGAPAEGVIQRGLPEPRAKRTVEGDLGMRHNALTIAEAAGIETIARDAGLAVDVARERIDRLARDVERLPGDPEEYALDRALARSAVRLAVERHAGHLETVYTAHGPATVQFGKDLTRVDTIIGTGGVLAHSKKAADILQAVVAGPTDALSLCPRQPQLLLDRDYILYACGLLASVEPEAAYDLVVSNLCPADKETSHEQC